MSFGRPEVYVIGTRSFNASRFSQHFWKLSNPLVPFRTSRFPRLFSLAGRLRKKMQRAGGCSGRFGKVEREKERKNEWKGKIELLAEEKETRIQMLMKLTRRALIWPLQIFAKRLKWTSEESENYLSRSEKKEEIRRARFTTRVSFEYSFAITDYCVREFLNSGWDNFFLNIQ